jgi:hypothetical protein
MFNNSLLQTRAIRHIDQRIRRHMRRRNTRPLRHQFGQLTPGRVAAAARHSTPDARRGHSLDLSLRLSPSTRKRFQEPMLQGWSLAGAYVDSSSMDWWCGRA